MRVRWSALVCTVAAGVAMGAGTVAAEQGGDPFDARHGEITMGEVLTLAGVAGREGADRAVGVLSERRPTGSEARVLLDGGRVPGFEVRNRLSPTSSSTTLNVLWAVERAPDGQMTVVWSVGGTTYTTHCEYYDNGDSELTVCETTPA